MISKDTKIYIFIVLIILVFWYFNEKVGFVLLALFSLVGMLEADYLRRRVNRISRILHKRGIANAWEFFTKGKERKLMKEAGGPFSELEMRLLKKSEEIDEDEEDESN